MALFGNIKEKLLRYIEVQLDLVKVNFIGRTAGVMSYVMFALLGLFVFCCIILFIGLGLTEIFVEAGMSRVMALFITAAIYFLLLIIIILLRRNITGFFTDSFIEVLTDEDEDEDEKQSAN